MLVLLLGLPVNEAEISLSNGKVIFFRLSSISSDTKKSHALHFLASGVQSLKSALYALRYCLLLKDPDSLAPTNISWLY